MPDIATLPHLDAVKLPPMIVPEKTCLIVVDIQMDFADPDGMPGQWGVDMAPVTAAIDKIEELIAAARVAGAHVGFMRVVTSPETDGNALKAYMERRGEPGSEAICRAGSGGEDYYRVAPEPGDIEIEKLLFSSFHGTGLDNDLRARGIDTLVVCGITTECCVDATVRDAFHHDYHVFVVSDACAAYDEDMHYGTLRVLERNCALLITTDAVKAAWTA
jgi:nicotinamidase-related amidase